MDPKLELKFENRLLFVGGQLIIPRYKDLWEQLSRLAHDHLRHFGGEKTYKSLRKDFYWPRMRKNLLNAYIPGCGPCQWNKSSTAKLPGPLHPLPIPDRRFDSVAINFVGPLPLDDGFDAIVTMMDWLGADFQIAACKTTMTVEEFVNMFFDKWYCENGCPLEIISDRDKIFISNFWKALMRLAGIKHKLLMAYHPETDGASERTNKTLVHHVERKVLPKVRFDMMSTVNA